MKKITLELRVDIDKFKRKLAAFLPGGPNVRRVLYDLDDLVIRFKHVKKFFVDGIAEVEIKI